MTIASREHAKFRQTDPDAAALMGDLIGLLSAYGWSKRAREIFFLGKEYSA